MQSIIDKKEIRAPFDGMAGIRYVNPGQMVAVGDKLVTLQALDQVFVDFSLPQQDLAKLKVGLPVKVTTDAIPGREFNGTLNAINPRSTPRRATCSCRPRSTTRTMHCAPGCSHESRFSLPQKNHHALIFPATAVSYAPYGDSVYVIEKKKDEKTEQRSAGVAPAIHSDGRGAGRFRRGHGGLERRPGRLSSTGVFKLRNGMDVADRQQARAETAARAEAADT